MDEDMLQYKDLYLQTADEYMSSLNKSLLVLEKNPTDTEAIKEIFRSAHSLKSQSAAMGYNQTAFLCHTVEDIFSLLKDGLRQMTPELADLLFEALDALTSSLQNIAQKDKEIDLTAQAEKLKQLTGVDTQGVGKSKDAASTAKKSEEPPQTKNNDTTSKTATNKHLAPQVKTVSVKTSQLDDMMNMMEELLIHRLTLKKIADELGHDKLKLYYNQTEKILESLQFLIMQARTVPLSIVFDHFPRAVRDVARKENKDISFRIIGADLKLDRTIVDRLDEPLIHILRNAVSHGIEKKGEIVLSAEREEDFAVIKVKDNGRGVNWKRVAEKANVKSQDVNVLKKYLFSGISTAEQITEVSGRGVGLQAVEKMVNQIGGRIDVESVAGHGTTFILKLPLTLAVTKALLVSVGKEKYA
ncbi:MAG TPA: ATP-binding protein, partial [bacterium]|nr:ATP-binding protein [bacterium]